MVPVLPPQAQWPPVLFRVTSSKTYRRLSDDYFFVSPFHQEFRNSYTTPEQKFISRHNFNEEFMRHLDTKREGCGSGSFLTPFISMTSSFCYALSVAKLHWDWGGENIKITIIDANSLDWRPAIWDAADVAISCNRYLPPGDGGSKDEFLIFGRLEGSERCFSVVKWEDYLMLTYKYRFLDEWIFQQTDKSCRRFENYCDGLPKRTTEYDLSDAAAALEIARAISLPRLHIPLLAVLLCSQDHQNWDDYILKTISKLSTERSLLTYAEIAAYYPFVFETYSRHYHHNVYDFFGEVYSPAATTSTKHVQRVYRCMTLIAKTLNDEQDARIKPEFHLSALAMLVGLFVAGVAKAIVKAQDRSQHGRLRSLNSTCPQAEKLATSYAELKSTVKKSNCQPLLSVYRCLQTAYSKSPSTTKASELVNFWAAVLTEANNSLKTDLVDSQGTSIESPRGPSTPFSSASKAPQLALATSDSPKQTNQRNRKRKHTIGALEPPGPGKRVKIRTTAGLGSRYLNRPKTSVKQY